MWVHSTILAVVASHSICYYTYHSPPYSIFLCTLMDVDNVPRLQDQAQEGMMEYIILLVGLIALDILALRWGHNSTDGIDSPEWERRRRRFGFL